MYGPECSNRSFDLAGLIRPNWAFHPNGGGGKQRRKFKRSKNII